LSTAAATACEWTGYLAEDFRFGEFPRDAVVLDVGFGTGEQMRHLTSRGCRVIGIEVDHELARRAQATGLPVCRSVAEALPFEGESFDGIVCKVVLPYTDEALAVAEISRVLKRGGVARVSYHGLGYSLRYLVTPGHWKRRFYAARVIVNTFVYRLTARRLPGFWGDTIFQSENRLRRYYAKAGLDLVDRPYSASFGGAPVFIYHELRRN
jgi:SAM-dependent methyltransferase